MTRKFLPFRLLAVGVIGILLNACAPGNMASSPQTNGKPTAVAPQQPGLQANSMLRQTPAVQPAMTPRRAALLLPLTGSQAALGQTLRNAALLAVQDLAPPNFELGVYDTAKGAQIAFNEAHRDGAQLLIGPLFSADVQTIRAAVQAAGLPMLALSNDISLAGQGVYVTGFWPGAQIARVVNYAAKHGHRRLAALVPDDAYGGRVVEALMQTQLKAGGLVRYASATAATDAAAQLAAQRGQFDTLLIAETGARTADLLAALRAQGLLTQSNGEPVQLLGSGLWDTPELAGQPGLRGAWYAAPDPSNRAAFDARYRQAFGDSAPRIASLAYDATALAAVMAEQNWPYEPRYLVQSQGFDGIDGLFRLRPEGVAERGLAILEFGLNGPQLLDPAPKTF